MTKRQRFQWYTCNMFIMTSSAFMERAVISPLLMYYLTSYRQCLLITWVSRLSHEAKTPQKERPWCWWRSWGSSFLTPELDLSHHCPGVRSGVPETSRCSQPPRVWHPLPHHRPVLIPSGPRWQSLGVVKLIGEGYRLFPGNPVSTF